MLPFAKYQGLGNDFILIDGLRARRPAHIDVQQAIHLCDRHFGIGADGVILVLPPQEQAADCRMQIINSDGSEAEMCGNGLRCLARFVWDEGLLHKTDLAVETLAGILHPHLHVEDGHVSSVTVEMGHPIWPACEVPTTLVAPQARAIDVPLRLGDATWVVTALRMGVPHCIVFVPDLEAVEWATIGPRIEQQAAFPQKTNVMFTQVLARDHLRVHPWERGAGPTLACGTGSCAAAVAAALTGRADPDVSVTLPGGTLRIRWDRESDQVAMTGPAERVFVGQVWGN